jgi:hypothetical protein
MSSLIDISFFVADINIPNTDQPLVEERLDYFITKYEKEFLRDLLGVALYNAFVAGLAEDPIAAKWTNLKSGCSYTGQDGRAAVWRGIVETLVEPVTAVGDTPAVAGEYQSMIANYVYYWYMRNGATQSSGVGEVVTNAENATIASPKQKMASAWNEMSTWIRELSLFLYAKAETYTEWDQQYHWRMMKKFIPINPIF